MHSWSCLPFLVWSQSLTDRRLALWKAEAIAEAAIAYSGASYERTPAELKAEARVDRALAKRNKWKKRACDKCRNAVRRMEA